MSSVVLVSLYFLALTAFLGLDILAKVPATMYALVLAALGTLAAVALVGGIYVPARASAGPSLGCALGYLGAGLGALAAGAGLGSLGRLLRAFVRKSRS